MEEAGISLADLVFCCFIVVCFALGWIAGSQR